MDATLPASTRARRCGSAALLLGLILSSTGLRAAEAGIAVASNFAVTMEALAASFEARTGHQLLTTVGSTGKLYAQIVNGAPFDVLLAADSERPRLLEESGHAVANSRVTYARGRLVLWSRDASLPAGDCLDELHNGSGKLSIANPDIAPYGVAARATLRSLGVWERLRSRLVMGENVGQALQFAATGNARLGFVAAAQLTLDRLPATRCIWNVPERYHEPIDQQAVLLMPGKNIEAARQFLSFLQGPEARRIVIENGYNVPDKN